MIIRKNYELFKDDEKEYNIRLKLDDKNYADYKFYDVDYRTLYLIFGRKHKNNYYVVILPLYELQQEELYCECEEISTKILFWSYTNDKAKEELTKNGYFYLGDNTTLDILNEEELENTIKKRYLINND